MRPVIETRITRHTIWQALTGQLPPLELDTTPIPRAVLDSRDVRPGDLFVALPGMKVDGHQYIPEAIDRGAAALICEERGRIAAQNTGAIPIDCTTGRWDLSARLPGDYRRHRSVAYVVDNSVAALQALGGFQRLHRTNPQLRVIGITGSVGKTSTKELAAAVLDRCYVTLCNPGNLNNEQGLPLTLLGLGFEHQRAVLEMGMYDLGEIENLCMLARPQVGVVTNVGPSHLSRLGTMDRIAQAKSELVRALPRAEDGGTAILNWDDDRVRAMASLTSARIFRYGLNPEADLWADDIESAGLDGIRFRFHHRESEDGVEEVLHVRIPLLGRHSVHTALRAAAVGLVEGMSWDDLVAGMQSVSGQLRLVVISGINGCTIIDDTYNASPASTIAALNLLADLEPGECGRRVAVLGDMLELGQFSDEGHKLVGRRAADVIDVLVTVGNLGRCIAEEAQLVNFPGEYLHAMEDVTQARDLLGDLLKANDLVLVKGSRAIGMEDLVNTLVVGRDETR